MAETKVTPNEMNNAILSQTNTGTAGGTMYYINLGGLKLLWGKSDVHSAAVNSAFGITFPSGFFTTVHSGTISASDISAYGMQADFVNAPNASGVSYYQANYAGTASMVANYLIIGV